MVLQGQAMSRLNPMYVKIVWSRTLWVAQWFFINVVKYFSTKSPTDNCEGNLNNRLLHGSNLR